MITRLTSSAVTQGLPKYRSMLAGNTAYDPSATWLIATASGTGSSNTITFSSIPQTYTSLQIRILGKDTVTGSGTIDTLLQLNGDTNTNYSRHYLRSDGTTVSVGRSANVSNLTFPNAMAGSVTSPNLANMFGTAIIDIHDYTSTNIGKTVRARGGVDANALTAGSVWYASGSWQWASPAAVTSVSLITGGTAWTTTTKIALYGMVG